MAGWVDVQTNAESRAGAGDRSFSTDQSWHEGDFNISTSGGGSALGSAGSIPPIVLYGALALAAWWLLKKKKG